jgi:hypothetical protein
MVRRTIVPKGKEVARNWRKLHDEELHNLCSLSDIIRMSVEKSDEQRM